MPKRQPVKSQQSPTELGDTSEASRLLERRKEQKSLLRTTLRYSQKEALASSAMTATSDNFFNAFAIYLQASMTQLGILTGIPQLFGAITQIISIWLGNHFCRKNIIIGSAIAQSITLLSMAAVAVLRPSNGIWYFIALALMHHGLLNLIQPQWRAWMGSIVPANRRGSFFALRTRIIMFASLCVFLAGGALLTAVDKIDLTWLGFSLLFVIAAVGRLNSAWLFSKMHDEHLQPSKVAFVQTLIAFKEAWQDPVFRQYSLLVATMQSMVAISAPFFAVYMLAHLEFTYLEFVLSGIASIVTQFFTLKFWEKFSDQFGNRLVIMVTSGAITLIPLLWLFSDSFIYIIAIQCFSGLWWSGFTLSTANYLYDIRPHHSNFATYAATQAGLAAVLVFVGSLLGGIVASYANAFNEWSGLSLWLSSSLFIVFICSSLGRLLVFFYFIPNLQDTGIRQRPKMLSLVLRVARFNAISGVNFDWLTVVKKKPEE
ncbi:MFS transporter [Brumicola nitratireducens]|uniref:Twin-arginine translocation pathway signal n=1 Tax=Glaciecola nitratireducens (strain JCM 12485 / KCTC 12276 / FR1064) TaxID=1085623 RepID=G4QEQ6_GLANF|nr:MFS transporter [Glaciecola nitratireducens]AEP29595.1 twin-arginine translocation pathway signal [Glaciecola nitratireducens FR1064]